ncbi:hypothetical protein TGVAND_276890 [Toxoplasma gondii VAND]|uniref:Uncharacterized protein n=1 Tax=Toxoplasma gondii VAND TaxID=933077 RepID=A0A086PGF0_TOXGO|nr:hypothetical protein TGVAND_276890 [Toxoplasma gondii VAND]
MPVPVAVSPQPLALSTPPLPVAPTIDLASLSARNTGVCSLRNISAPPVLSCLYNDADSLRNCVRNSIPSGGGGSRNAPGLGAYGDLTEMHPKRPPLVNKPKVQLTLPAAYGYHASLSRSRHTRPDVEGVIHRYERVFQARLYGGPLDSFGCATSAPYSASQQPQPSSTEDRFQASLVPVAGLSGDYPVKLSRHEDEQEVYPALSSFLDTGAVRHSLQLSASLRCDKDARRWHHEREALLRELRGVPPLHIDDALQREAAAHSDGGTLASGDLTKDLKRTPPLLQIPVLTAPEYCLMRYLSFLQHSQLPGGSLKDTHLPLHVLLQLPATLASAGVAVVEGKKSTSISIESETEQLQLQLETRLESPTVSSLYQVSEESCLFFSRRQRQHFAALFRQVIGCCRLLLQELHGLAASDKCPPGPQKQRDDADSRGFLRALVGNSLATLEHGRREELDKTYDCSGIATRWWTEWGIENARWCPGAREVFEFWISLATEEWQEDRLACRPAADGDAGESEKDERDAIWWRAVYYAFRTADIKCLIALGAGDFLPSGGCTFEQACAAVQAAALAPVDSGSQRDKEKEIRTSTDFGRSLPPQPPLLPFVCRHLLALVLSSSVEANRRNLPDVTVNEEERKNVAEMLAALPSADSLKPPSLPVIIGQLLLLYPPETVATGETNRTTERQTRQGKDPYLPLLLSLINPSMWPPVNAAISLRRFLQEDFLHYKLHLALLSSSQALDSQSALSTSLQELAEKFRQRGAAYFDSSASNGFSPSRDRVHVNVGYPRMLAACGCCFQAVTWLMDNSSLFKRSSLLLLLLLRACGVSRCPQLKQLDPFITKFDYADHSVSKQGSQREDMSSFDCLIDKGLEGSSDLTKILLMTVLPTSRWRFLSRSLAAHDFAVVSSPAVLGCLAADGDAIHPGVLEHLLGCSALSPAPESVSLGTGHELSAGARWRVEKRNHRLLLCLYTEIRDEGRRRRALVEALTAAWLLRDFPSCLEILFEALDSDVFSNFDSPPDEADSRKAKFFLAAYPLLERCLPLRETREIHVSWLQSRILWRARQGEFRSALSLFAELIRSSKPLLSFSPPSTVPWAEGTLHTASALGVARLVDCVAYVLLRLVERGEPLHSLISHKLLVQMHEICLTLSPSASPRLSRTRATLNQFLRQYTDSQCASLVF